MRIIVVSFVVAVVVFALLFKLIIIVIIGVKNNLVCKITVLELQKSEQK
jgi:hypothetical protein